MARVVGCPALTRRPPRASASRVGKLIPAPPAALIFRNCRYLDGTGWIHPAAWAATGARKDGRWMPDIREARAQPSRRWPLATAVLGASADREHAAPPRSLGFARGRRSLALGSQPEGWRGLPRVRRAQNRRARAPVERALSSNRNRVPWRPRSRRRSQTLGANAAREATGADRRSE